MLSTVLVPLDGSPLGEAALPWATLVARNLELTPVLIRVVQVPIYAMTGGMNGYLSPEVYQQILADEQQTAERYLEQVRGRLASEGVQAETRVVEGRPGDALLDLADELGAFAIVMATHGRGGLGRLVLGSVAEQVVQHATVPVLLVRAREGPGPAASFSRLLVPLDGSALAECALDVARMVATPETRFTLLRVVPPAERVFQGGDGTIRLPDDQATQRAVAAAEAYLRRLAEQQLAGRPVATVVRIGQAAEQIAAAAQDADLVVMSTHGHTGPARWVLGSVADAVVRTANRPVLLASARALAARALGSLAVRDVMTRDVSVIVESESLRAALRKLLRRRVSGLPVVNAAGEVVGVLSERDLLRWQRERLVALARGAGDEAAGGVAALETTTVGEVMSKPAVVLEDTAPLTTALDVLVDQHIGRLPVTHQGRLIGIVTRSDVLRAMAALAELEPGEARG